MLLGMEISRFMAVVGTDSLLQFLHLEFQALVLCLWYCKFRISLSHVATLYIGRPEWSLGNQVMMEIQEYF